GMGAVYEAVHVTRGHGVALKTLPTVNPEALHRFKREFRLAAEMTHPNLVGLHTLENDGGQYFITMDLVSGVDFRSWVRPGNVLNENRLRAALPQLIAAVMALHAQGVVHRDLKPQNVLVTIDGRVVVLDFGLVADLAGATGSLANIAGTPLYMAPEQAAGNVVGPPADWYSVGVMLYEALSGGLPFQSTNVWQLLQQKQAQDAPQLPDDPSLPAELVQLCLQLLDRSPIDRPDPLAIAGAVQAHVPASVQRTGSPDELIGRETHLAALIEANQTISRTGEPVTLFITGRSGEGKTALAERFLGPLRGDPAVVLSGRCYDRESVPFKALDTLIGALIDHLRSLPSEKAAQLLPDDIGILARLFPELNRCEVIATAPSSRIDAIDQQQIRARAFGALRLLLDRISQSASMVLFIDDLQWGDEDSARALFEVLRPPTAPRVLFLGSYRSDEADDSPFLTEWRELQRINAADIDEREIRVGPLSLEQSISLVINQLDLDNDTVRRRAVQFYAQTG
ncbi:MAG: serine/threonine-protein kinase PknK, partial [Planctomycetaceae bacterium]|nr:serine/threonine-protein kinase PknK [Planctomycetaceae bacterium]